MKVAWLLERDLFEEELERYRAEIARQGMESTVWHYVPTDDTNTFLDLYPDDSTCVIVYGSLQFGLAVKRAATWVPGVWLNLAQLDCTYYFPRLGPFLLNQNYAMLPFGELSRRREWLLEHVGRDGRVFLRPATGLKSFSGKVVTSETWQRDIELLAFYDVLPEELVVAAEPANVEQEWRLVVGGTVRERQSIIAASSYKEAGTHRTSDPGAPSEVLAFAETVLHESEYRPDPVWTLDVCRTHGGELRVLEVGSFSCASLFACDPATVVREVSRIAVATWQATRS